MVTALAASLSVSPMTSSRGRPLMPPSWLILATAISATSLVGVPILAAGPDRANMAPILMGSAFGAGSFCSVAARAPPAPNTRTVATRKAASFLSILASPLLCVGSWYVGQAGARHGCSRLIERNYQDGQEKPVGHTAGHQRDPPTGQPGEQTGSVPHQESL